MSPRNLHSRALFTGAAQGPKVIELGRKPKQNNKTGNISTTGPTPQFCNAVNCISESPNAKEALLSLSTQSFKRVLPYHLEDNSQNSQTDF